MEKKKKVSVKRPRKKEPVKDPEMEEKLKFTFDDRGIYNLMDLFHKNVVTEKSQWKAGFFFFLIAPVLLGALIIELVRRYIIEIWDDFKKKIPIKKL